MSLAEQIIIMELAVAPSITDRFDQLLRLLDCSTSGATHGVKKMVAIEMVPVQ